MVSSAASRHPLIPLENLPLDMHLDPCKRLPRSSAVAVESLNQSTLGTYRVIFHAIASHWYLLNRSSCSYLLLLAQTHARPEVGADAVNRWLPLSTHGQVYEIVSRPISHVEVRLKELANSSARHFLLVALSFSHCSLS